MIRDVSKEIRERCVKSFMDLIIMSLLVNTPMCGYDIIATIHQRLQILLSPGAVYPLLSSLEKEGYVKWTKGQSGRKKIYSLTPEGVKRCERMLAESRQIYNILSFFTLVKVGIEKETTK